MEDKNYLNELFNRYLNNQCSEEELEVLLKYFGSEPNNANLKRLVREQLDVFDTNSAQPDHVNGILKHAYKNIANETFLKNKQEAKVISFNRGIFVKIAACAAIVMLAGVFYFRYTQYPSASSNNNRQTVTLNSERKKLQLADGTMIWLAPGSTLNYPEEFTGKTREVTLKGEAFFDVTHDRQHPFIIHTGKINTTVYGTVFNVQAYPERTSVEVALVSGKVGVTEPGRQANQLMLAPNQRVVFNKTNHQLYKEDYPAAVDLLARRNGRFIYRGTTLGNVADDISKVYNVSVVLSKKTQDLRYYGEFDQKDDLQKVLMQISLTASMKLKNSGTIWELY